MLIGRVLVGVGSGAATGVVPLYLTEIAPLAIRGALGTMSQLGIVGGILISSALGLTNVLGNLAGVHYLLGLPLVPGLFLVACFLTMPESPRWLLLARGQPARAQASLQLLRGRGANVQGELDELQAEKDRAGAARAMSIPALLASRSMRQTLLIGIGLQAAQQLTGINAIFYFSTGIFERANVPNGDVATTGASSHPRVVYPSAQSTSLCRYRHRGSTSSSAAVAEAAVTTNTQRVGWWTGGCCKRVHDTRGCLPHRPCGAPVSTAVGARHHVRVFPHADQ